jgi:CelD/BcsL family acetyltransferase involved in cellulose biosynthesis
MTTTATVRVEPCADRRREPLADATITVFASFSAAASAWQRAENACVHYGFQSFAWLDSWQRTIGAAERVTPLIVSVADTAGAPLLLLPLGIRRDKTCRVLCFLGDDPTDYHAPLIAPDFAAAVTAADFAALWLRILAHLPPVDMIDLRKMPTAIEGVPNPMAFLPDAAPADVALSTALPASFAEFAKTRSTSFFAQNRRKRRQLAALGEVAFEIPTDDAARREILHAAFRQKTRRVAETGARDRLSRAGYKEFYERVATQRFATGGLHVACLRVGDTVVATHVGLVHGRRYYILMPGYEDGSWTKYSAGRLLIESLIDWAIAQRLAVFDFTIGDEDYKRSWAETEMPLYALREARSAKGAMLLAGQFCWQRLRQNARLRALLLPLRDIIRGKRRSVGSD